MVTEQQRFPSCLPGPLSHSPSWGPCRESVRKVAGSSPRSPPTNQGWAPLPSAGCCWSAGDSVTIPEPQLVDQGGQQEKLY